MAVAENNNAAGNYQGGQAWAGGQLHNAQTSTNAPWEGSSSFNNMMTGGQPVRGPALGGNHVHLGVTMGNMQRQGGV